jgi:hypothetical protein
MMATMMTTATAITTTITMRASAINSYADKSASLLSRATAEMIVKLFRELASKMLA